MTLEERAAEAPAGSAGSDVPEWLSLARAAAVLDVPAAVLRERLRDHVRAGTIPRARVRRRERAIFLHRTLLDDGLASLLRDDDPEPNPLPAEPEPDPLPDEPAGPSGSMQASIDDLYQLIAAQAREIQALKLALASGATAAPAVATDPAAGAAESRGVWIGRAALARAGSSLASVAGGSLVTVAVAGLTIGVLAWLLLADLGRNPAGFFADEAEIGLATRELIDSTLPSLNPALFYTHFPYTMGALPLYAGGPVISILGLSDVSVRLVSVIWSVAALLVLLALVRRLDLRYGEIGVVLFACTPVFIHLSRINFGHAPSMFALCLGIYAYVRARDGASWAWAIGAGLAIGVSAYGNASYSLAAPVIVAGLLVGEAVVSRRAWAAYRWLGLMIATVALTWVPIAVRSRTDERFMRRYWEKETTGEPLLSWSRISEIIDSYPKYFDTRYLFTVGETGLPGGWNMRHSVPGAGILTWIALPLVLAGVIALFRYDGSRRVIGVAGVVIMLLYPVPDITTTTDLNPPYTIAVFSTLIFVPLLAALGVHWITTSLSARSPQAAVLSRAFTLGLLAVILLGAVRFHQGPYADYPLVASEYGGWQFGPRPAFDIFQEHRDGYDQYVWDPDFNESYVFRDFYLADDPELRAKTIIGHKGYLDWNKRQLFAMRADKFDALMSSPDFLRRYARVVDIVRYPSGQIVLYIVEFDLEYGNGRRADEPF